NLIGIDRLYDGIEASVEIVTRVSGGFRVGKNRGPRLPALYLFEIAGSDPQRSFKQVLIKWFVSGKQAQRIIHYYEDRFPPGTHFVAYGRWEWDERRQTFQLMLKKPEELEILTPVNYELFDGVSPASEPEGAASGLLHSPVATAPGPGTSSDAVSYSSVDTDLMEDIGDPAYAMIHTGRRVPVYRKLGQFQTKRLRETIHSVLENLD